ncbi:MAG: peptide ABC transporter substrate-binding protein [Chloroflexota bacterium]
MKRLRWQLLIVMLSLGVIGVLLFRQQPVTQEALPEPTTGGVYTEALIGAPSRFNPLLDYNNPVDRDVDRLIYSSLIRSDAQGLPQPDLAESWGISRDGTIYNVSLRMNAYWHDGEQVLSEDVLFTLEMMLNPEFPIPEDLRVFWSTVQVKKYNDFTLQFRLPEPFSPFLDFLTFNILPKHIWDGLTPQELIASELNFKPIGSGAFKFDRLLVEGGKILGVVLSPFADYYLNPPFIEQFIFRFYPDASSAFQAYEEREVIGLGRVTPNILQPSLAEPGLNVYTSRMPELSIILFNLNNPKVGFLQEPQVREALLSGLNRQWMIDHILDGQALIADGPVLPGTWAHYEGVEHVAYNPEKAIELLRQIGFVLPAEGGVVREKDGQALSFTLLYPQDEQHRLLAEAIQHDWEQIGVELELEAVSYEELLRVYLNPRSFQAVLVDFNLGRFPDPDPYPFWHQTQVTGGQNYSQWNDRQASEYLEQARITVDPEERARLYRNFQIRFMRELPALPLFYPVYTYAVDIQVYGVRVGPLFEPSDRFATVLNWYLVTTSETESQASPTFTPEQQ